MRLICYPTSIEPPRIRAAPFERAWMDATSAAFAYRCLPLNIANAHGWVLLNTVPFSATWDGTNGLDAIRIEAHGDSAGLLGASHFGYGVLTFSVHGLFRTEPGYDLVVTGPFNLPKDAIQPLTGVVETDWSPFTFTMNWKFTRRQTPVMFGNDEPFCMIFPVKRSTLEATEPVILPMEQDPAVQKAYQEWTESRRAFNVGLKLPGSGAQKQQWQKDYFRGNSAVGAAPQDHRSKLRLPEFAAPPAKGPGK
jgi:hypothetical protein